MKFYKLAFSIVLMKSGLALSAVDCTAQWQACTQRCEAYKDPTKCNQNCDNQYDTCRRSQGTSESQDDAKPTFFEFID